MSNDPDSSDRRSKGEMARLAALAALDVLDTPAEREFDMIAELAADRFDTPIALASLVASDRLWFKARVGLEIQETARDFSMTTAARERPLL